MQKIASFQLEKKLWEGGHSLVLGVDEAGRGCLAGPVYAAIAAWKKEEHPTFSVYDSKQLSKQKREESFLGLRKTLFLWGVGCANRQEVDKWNITKATGLALARALESVAKTIFSLSLEHRIAYLVDGSLSLVQIACFFSHHPSFEKELTHTRKLLCNGFSELPVIKGDEKSISIASASIVAKVSRDRCMLGLGKKYPQYKFQEHKGYATKQHKELLQQHGPCREHRRSFALVKDLHRL